MKDKYFRVMGTVLLISVAFFIIAKLNFNSNYSVTVSYYDQSSKTISGVSVVKIAEESKFDQEELVPETTATKEISVAEESAAEESVAEEEIEEITVSFPLELNHIAYEELLLLPNVGHVTATRIVQYRDYLGGYSSLEQLMEIKGIGESTFQDISGYLYLS